MSGELKLFDADTHCYEPRDAFVRHIDPRLRDEALRAVVDGDGQELIIVGDKVVTFTDGNLFEKVHVPGTLKEKLRAMKDGSVDDERFFQEPRPEFLGPDARLADLDRQGVAGCLLFPGLGLFVESFCRRTDVLYANLDAFNRWLFDTWGFDRDQRIFSTPAISLRDRDEAVRQVEWVVERGARLVMLRTGPAYGRSPGDPYFDPVWARLHEAGVNVAFHITESGYNEQVAVHWGEDANPTPFRQSAWQWMCCYGDRAIMDTLAALIYDNLFGRYPGLRVISVEHGAEWVPYFLGRLDKMRGMGRNGPWRGGSLLDRPSRVFNEHVRVVPYPEDDVARVVAQAGSKWLVMGSDYPHGEGMADPGDMVMLVEFLPDDERRAVCHDRGFEFVGVTTGAPV